MDRISELETVLENILELFDGDETVETNDGELVFISTPLSEALHAAEIVLYGERDDATGAF